MSEELDYKDEYAKLEKIVFKQEAIVTRLEIENARLRAVIETHDLCHNLHGKVDARAFNDGCNEEMRKLYGCAPDADELSRLREAAEAFLMFLESPAGYMGGQTFGDNMARLRAALDEAKP